MTFGEFIFIAMAGADRVPGGEGVEMTRRVCGAKAETAPPRAMFFGTREPFRLQGVPAG